jgi:hypothetical protein
MFRNVMPYRVVEVGLTSSSFKIKEQVNQDTGKSRQQAQLRFPHASVGLLIHLLFHKGSPMLQVQLNHS